MSLCFGVTAGDSWWNQGCKAPRVHMPMALSCTARVPGAHMFVSTGTLLCVAGALEGMTAHPKSHAKASDAESLSASPRPTRSSRHAGVHMNERMVHPHSCGHSKSLARHAGILMNERMAHPKTCGHSKSLARHAGVHMIHMI